MSDFTWYRGRSGASIATATDAVLNVGMANVETDGPTTVRRVIVRWSLDLLAVGTDATINTDCPITIGLIYNNNESNDPVPPFNGPKTSPDEGWFWWDGAYYTNAYGFGTDIGENGATFGTGKIDRQIPFALPTDQPWNKFYMTFEIEDVDHKFSSFQAQTYWQVLTAPTVG